jgi:hypothetical protein
MDRLQVVGHDIAAGQLANAEFGTVGAQKIVDSARRQLELPQPAGAITLS